MHAAMHARPLVSVGAPDDESARDAVLVGRACTGDEDAMRALVRRHMRTAHGVARALLGNVADAEDACQDAFAAVFARLDRCAPAHKFRPWLLQCVRNRAISLLRQRSARHAEPLGTGPGEWEVRATRASDPSAAAERAELRERLVGAMATLRAEERETLILHDVEGWKHEEIAAHLGVRTATSRSRLFDARRRLRALLGPALARDVG
jgi:RNA polymerase sigma factor (sigma-70 family)